MNQGDRTELEQPSSRQQAKHTKPYSDISMLNLSGNVDSSGFSIDRILISASAVPGHCGT